MNTGLINTKNSIDYWVNEAKEIILMINGDEICSAFTIAAYLRSFYLEGKEHGIWLSNNAPRD